MLLIGSSAIKHHFPDFNREPKDLDYAVTKEEMSSLKSSKGTEYLLNDVVGHLQGTADPDLLYTLKMSHAVGWDINWDKHVFDIQFLRSKGCRLEKGLFYRLHEYWQTVYSKSTRSDLGMSSAEFFDNALKKEHDHDFLHALINPVPTFNKVLKDGAEVDVDEGKFDLLTFEEKCDLVSEEVMVMAYERYKDSNHQVAYSRMLKKFVRSHAPLWEAIFILENYTRLHRPAFNYFKKINDGLKKNQ